MAGGSGGVATADYIKVPVCDVAFNGPPLLLAPKEYFVLLIDQPKQSPVKLTKAVLHQLSQQTNSTAAQHAPPSPIGGNRKVNDFPHSASESEEGALKTEKYLERVDTNERGDRGRHIRGWDVDRGVEYSVRDPAEGRQQVENNDDDEWEEGEDSDAETSDRKSSSHTASRRRHHQKSKVSPLQRRRRTRSGEVSYSESSEVSSDDDIHYRGRRNYSRRRRSIHYSRDSRHRGHGDREKWHDYISSSSRSSISREHGRRDHARDVALRHRPARDAVPPSQTTRMTAGQDVLSQRGVPGSRPPPGFQPRPPGNVAGTTSGTRPIATTDNGRIAIKQLLMAKHLTLPAWMTKTTDGSLTAAAENVDIDEILRANKERTANYAQYQTDLLTIDPNALRERQARNAAMPSGIPKSLRRRVGGCPKRGGFGGTVRPLPRRPNATTR